MAVQRLKGPRPGLVLLIGATACREDPAQCGLPRTAEDTGAAIHTCALSCEDAEAARECCIVAEGRGAAEAEGGFCADPECLQEGAACENTACDPSKIITAAAAICIAQVDGLAPGLHGLRAEFRGAADAIWDVENYWWTTCDEGVGETASQGREVSGLTGEVLAQYEEIGPGCIPGRSP